MGFIIVHNRILFKGEINVSIYCFAQMKHYSGVYPLLQVISNNKSVSAEIGSLPVSYETEMTKTCQKKVDTENASVTENTSI